MISGKFLLKDVADLQFLTMGQEPLWSACLKKAVLHKAEEKLATPQIRP